MKIIKNIFFKDSKEVISILGVNEENLKLVEGKFPVKMIARGHGLSIQGSREDVKKVIKLFASLKTIYNSGEEIQTELVKHLLSNDLITDAIAVPSKKRFIRPKTIGQKRYIEAIKHYDIVIAIGPAGTGKTYLSVAMAVSAFQSGKVNRIILTRPAVEAGEKLGFLPGTFQEKVHPYLRPLYDALYDMIEVDKFQELLSRDIIEVAPLAYMRGRTLNDAFIILDEAQNTTPEQIKMFLTRLGFGSKAVITGDITQVDLPKDKSSGLIHVQTILKRVDGIKFVYLTGKDAVRHKLVQKIIHAYDTA